MVRTKDIPVVLIRWKDARGVSPNWHELEEAKEMTLCEIWSFGFLIHECTEKLIIAPHVEFKQEDMVCGVMAIPAGSVIEKRILDLKTTQRSAEE